MGALAAAMFDLRSRQEQTRGQNQRSTGETRPPMAGRENRDERKTGEEMKSLPDLKQVNEKGDGKTRRGNEELRKKNYI